MTDRTYAIADRTKYLLIAVVVILAFFAAYGFAASRSSAAANAASSPTANGVGAASACSEDGAACGVTDGTAPADAAQSGSCCGGGAPEQAPEGSTVADAGVQRISVDVSQGYFDPTVIRAAPGVPIEIAFGQGAGCLAEVMFPEFGVREDLTGGGAVVSLPALEVGEYDFSCGMEMVFGKIIVE